MEDGKMINNKAKASKNGKMEHFIKASTNLAKNKAKALLFGVMTVHTKANFYRTIFMEKENMYGRMVVYMKVNGLTIKCMVQEFLHGLTGVNMKGLTKMIKNMDSVFSCLKMAAFMKVSGKMANSTVGEFTKKRKSCVKAFGRMGSELNG